jgi:hypothetical protein
MTAHAFTEAGVRQMTARVRYVPTRLIPLMPLMLSLGWQVITVAEVGDTSWVVMYWPGRARASA